MRDFALKEAEFSFTKDGFLDFPKDSFFHSRGDFSGFASPGWLEVFFDDSH